MLRAALALSLVTTLARPALADHVAPTHTCKAVAADAKLRVSFAADVSLRELATWVTGFSCKNVIFATDVANRAPRVTVVSPKEMTPKQALALFVDAVEAAGLVVTVKPSTIIITPGPNTARSCPTLADSGGGLTGAPSVDPPVEQPEVDDLTAEVDRGIKVVDETHREITRALVDQILLNPMAVAKGARVVPSIKDGKPNGFKLYAIRPSSVYARLGFANGDTLVAINGLDLTSADKALEVYTKLRDAKRLEVQILRRGKPLTLVIVIK